MKSTRWAWISAAIRPRPCSKCWIRNRTPPSWIITRSGVRPVQRDVHHHGQHAQHSPALLDRMEIIRIAGYTEEESSKSPSGTSCPRRSRNMRCSGEFSMTDAAVMAAIPHLYPRSRRSAISSARLMKVARKAVTEILKGKTKSVRSDRGQHCRLSRRAALPPRRSEREDQVGVVTGLAWTEVGGELLTIEGVMMRARAA